jgi:glycosyltransferase involved in cell wall biosynthesis
MKILVVSHSCVVDLNQQLYQELAALPDVEVQLIVPARWRSEYTRQPMRPHLLEGLKPEVSCLPVAFPGNNHLHFYLWLPFRRLLAYRPDLIFMHQEPWSLVALQLTLLSLMLRCRLIFFTNQNLVKTYPPPFSWINALTFKRSSQAIALSTEVARVLRTKGYKGPITYLPFGIDPKNFYPKSNRTTLRRDLGLSEELVIGYVGRLVEEKGVQVLLKAVAALEQRADLPYWKLILVGAGDYQLELERMAKELKLEGRVKFLGTMPHARVADYLNCLDLLVLPSLTTPRWKEQFGRIIIEALACGVPVVGSDSGEIPYLLKATGGGLVTPEGGVSELCEALAQLLAQPALRYELAENGLRTVRENYTNAALALSLARLFQEDVINKR